MRMNRWRDHGKLKGEWYCEIYAAFVRDAPTKAEGRRRIKITIRSKGMRDQANQYLAADKLLLDNLKSLGWIVDDSPKWIELEVAGETGAPRTIIEIGEI